MPFKSIVTLSAVFALAGSAFAGSIGLQNTGVAGSSWDILETGTTAVNVSPRPGSWLANTAASSWVWENTSGQPVNVIRTFRQSFDMSGFDLTTAVIAGRWSVDNYGNDILVNGVSTGASAGGFSSWYGFSVNNSLLTSGINTIDFVVQDVGGISGFRSEFTVATAQFPRFRGLIVKNGRTPQRVAAFFGREIPTRPAQAKDFESFCAP